MLLKNVFKTLRGRWLQLIAIGLIIILSSLTYTMMFYGLSGIEEPTETYLKEYRQEDFAVEFLNRVTPEEAEDPKIGELAALGRYALSDVKQANQQLFDALIAERRSQFLKEYPGTQVELRQFKTFQYDFKGRDHQALLVKDASAINRSYFEEGRAPGSDEEVALTKVYADKNGISIGDSFRLAEKTYRVSGFVLVPDYTLPVFQESFFNIDTALQTIVVTTDQEYEQIRSPENYRFSGTDAGEPVETTFDAKKLPFVTKVENTESIMRSGAIYGEITEGKVVALGLSIFIATLAVIIVALMISNLLQAERGQIGILKALGYRRIEIALPYLTSMMFLALVMLVIGYIVGSFLAEPLKALYLDFYLLPSSSISQRPVVFATAIIVPLAFFALISGLIIYEILGASALSLLTPQQSKSLNRLSRSVSRLLSHAKSITKFKYLYAIRSTSSFLLFFVGIMFSTLLIIFSFMMVGMIDRMTVESLKKYEYAYEAYIDPAAPPALAASQEKFLTYPYATVDGDLVTLHGLAKDNRLHRLYDGKTDISSRTEDGAVLTRQLSMKLGLEAGETVTVKVDDETFVLKVAGVADEYVSKEIYLDIETLSRMLSEGRTGDLFSGVYSKQRPESAKFPVIIEKAGVIDQAKAMDDYVQLITRVMIGTAAGIASSILFVLTSLPVEKNYLTISLLKVMGYTRREVNAMVLNSYFAYTVLSCLVSIPLAYLILYMMMRFFLSEYDVILPLRFEPEFVLYTLAIILTLFFASTAVSRRKIERTPLQEVLKTYGE